MAFNPDIHHRHSLRLRGYDYSQAGAYFITICTHNRECLFGEVVDGVMRLNNAGRVVVDVWNAIPDHFPHVGIDVFAVMPNHVHGIIIVGAQFIASQTPQTAKPNTGAMNRTPTVGHIIRAFKARVARTIRLQENKSFGWQRNYYEHIIRDEPSLERIREYIINNPLQWALDRENPANSKEGEP